MTNKLFSVKSEKESLGFLLWQVTTTWQREIKKALKKHNITHPQFVVLASLAWFTLQKETCTQIKLSKHTKMDKVTIGEIIKILEKNSLIKRDTDKTDSRSYTLHLTKKGFEIASSAVKDVEEADKTFFKVLDKKESLELKSILLKTITE